MTRYKGADRWNIDTSANVGNIQSYGTYINSNNTGREAYALARNSRFVMSKCTGLSPDCCTELDDICCRINSFEVDDCDHCNIGSTIKTCEMYHFYCTIPEVVFQQDKDGDTLLHLAIILQEICLAMYFINNAPSFNFLSTCNYLFQTPLHLATLIKHVEIVRRLVVGGADVEIRDKDGNTPLHIACRDGLFQIAQALLEPVRYPEIKENSYEIPYQRIPQDFTITNYDGCTCLHLAAMNGHIGTVQILLEKGIDINLRAAKTGRTILHEACVAGDMELVTLLLKYKSCNVNAKAYDERTPYDIASCRGHELICVEMAAAGASYGEYVDEDTD